jgi:hypothetical protein
MKALITRPKAAVTRENVEAALIKLMRDQSSTRLRMAMRTVDEYAATLNTSRMYARVEQLVQQALVDAHRAVEDGDKIFLCTSLCEHEKFFKIFNRDFLPKGPMIVEIDRSGTNDMLIMPGTMTGTMVDTMVDTKCDIVPCTNDKRPLTNDIDPYTEENHPSTDDISPPADTDSEPVKACTRCGGVLPLDRYTRNRSRADGLASSCRDCEVARKRKTPVRVDEDPPSDGASA